jgi:hypothetical protein
MYVLVYLVYFKYLFTKRHVRELPVASFGGVLPSLSYVSTACVPQCQGFNNVALHVCVL